VSSSAYARAYPPRSSRRRIFFNHRDDPFRGPHIGAGESSDTRDGERRRTSFRRKMQWTYVAYLGGLDALLLRRDPGGAIGNGGGAIREPRWGAFCSIVVRIHRNRRRPCDDSGPQRRSRRSPASGADGESRSLADPDNNSGRRGLLARGRDGSVAGAPRRDPRTCRRDRPRARLSTRLGSRALRPTLFAFVSAMAAYMAREAWIAS
jgi:hypothetical protein